MKFGTVFTHHIGKYMSLYTLQCLETLNMFMGVRDLSVHPNSADQSVPQMATAKRFSVPV